MDLVKSGKMLFQLRKAKGMTQKQVAEALGVMPKTVSKWETGHGFPDISLVSELSKVLGISTNSLLNGVIEQNKEDIGNMKRTKFYVCPYCQSFMQGNGQSGVICCGRELEALNAKQPDEEHNISVSEIENDFYIKINHEMTKEHYISFVSYVSYDRVLTVRLYPEQDSAVRFPKMHGGKLYYFCSNHGLFEYTHKKHKNKGNAFEHKNLTALMSAFARAYHAENSSNKVFNDYMAKKLLSSHEYEKIKNLISDSTENCNKYINTYLAPIPLARSRFCEDSLKTDLSLGTTQYLIIGSGLDTFSLRNSNPKLKVFEIDKEEIIQDKIRHINNSGIELPQNTVYISSDLSGMSFIEDISKSSFNPSLKTYVSCLGLFYYLTKDEIENLLKNLSLCLSDGGTLVFDFPDSHLFSSVSERVKNMLEMTDKSGNKIRTCFSYNEIESILEKYGFHIYEFLNYNDIQERYFKNSDNDLTAFEHIDFILAVYKK